MNDLKVRRWTGFFGVATVILWLSQFPLYMTGNPPAIYDGTAFGQFLFTIQNVVFTRILLNLGVYVTSMVFAAGFRHLIRQARPDYEWAGTLVFGGMVVWIAVTLVANGLEGAAVLATLGGKADPSVVRALWEGTLLIYNSSIAFALTGLFLGAAGYATFATGVLPEWTGWVAMPALRSVPHLFRRCMAAPSTFAVSITPVDGAQQSWPISRRPSGFSSSVS